MEVVWRLDVRQRPSRYVQKIYNDIIYYLGERYRREWRREKLEIPTDPHSLKHLAGTSRGLEFAEAERRIDMEFSIRRLRKILKAGVISKPDFDLLLGTRIYGRSIAAYARENGLRYGKTRKRRQRAEARICRFLERSADSVSPSESWPPPFLYGGRMRRVATPAKKRETDAAMASPAERKAPPFSLEERSQAKEAMHSWS
jgi:hypothetical protein